METIKINKNFELNLNFETQYSPLGRPIRLSGTSKNLQKPSKWIGKIEHWHWIHDFKFLDEKGGFISFEVDFFGKYVCTIKK